MTQSSENQSKRKLKDPFKLVLLREETLEEVGSYRLTLLNVYLLISTVLVLTGLIIIALVFFTPLKRLVPGYGDVYESREYRSLVREMSEVEKQLEAQQLYIESFRRIAMGDTVYIAQEEIPDASQADRYSDPEFPVDEGLLENVLVISPDTLERTRLPANQVDYLYFISPLAGQVSQGFKPEEEHFGIDILAPFNTPVKAILDGHVIASDWTLETGNTVGIQHANGIVSFYKHNSRNLKRLGSFVRAGEAVAIIGSTGELSTGPHLHFELWINGQPVDPADYVDFR